MATKKPTSSSARSKSTPKPAAASQPRAMTPSKLQNLAARPSYDDMLADDQLVDQSGVFRVTAAIQQAQTGHEEDATLFPGASGSLPIARGGDFQDDGPTLEDPLAERVIQDESSLAEKRQRLATLAARAKARDRTR
jgi:hypothetical protein